MRSTVDEINNCIRNNDWLLLLSLFEKLNKQAEKAQRAVQVEIPKLYFRALIDIEESLSLSFNDKDSRKQMSSTNAKAFMSLRQRIKKHSKIFEAELGVTRMHPESSSSESEVEGVLLGRRAETIIGDQGSVGEIEFERDGKDDGLFTKAEKKDITYEMVEKKLAKLCASRGKKGTDRVEFVDQLSFLSTLAKCPAQEIEILINVSSAQFDAAGSITSYMSVKVWNNCANNIFKLLNLLAQNQHISIIDQRDSMPRPSHDAIMEGSPVEYWCSLSALIERLDDEYFKSLQSIDPHSKDYVLRLQDENILLSLMFKVTKYYEFLKGEGKNLVKIFLRILEHLSRKTDELYNLFAANVRHHTEEEQFLIGSDANTVEWFSIPEELSTFIEKLATYIYKNGDDRSRSRAIICEVYQKAVSGQFYAGRELLLLSHLHESIAHADVSMQILFNRALAELGICGFKKGLFIEAHACLNELFTGGRVKELLAQGISTSRFHERSLEQEKLERRRQMPFHLHINMELLESIFMICSMVVEATNMMYNSGHSRLFSKPFNRIFELYERQSFNGPPESIRDSIMSATNFLLVGDWRKASELVSKMNIWTSLSPGGETILAKLVQRLKEVSYEVYMIQHAAQYTAADISTLTEMFDLSSPILKSITFRMISREEVLGAYDKLTDSITIGDRMEKSRIQLISSRFSEKVSAMLDLNDHALSFQVGASGVLLYLNEDDGLNRNRRINSDEVPLGRTINHSRVGRSAVYPDLLERKINRRFENITSKGKFSRNDEAHIRRRSGKLDYVDRIETNSSDRMVALGNF